MCTAYRILARRVADCIPAHLPLKAPPLIGYSDSLCEAVAITVSVTQYIVGLRRPDETPAVPERS
jgi:hypothetical protein